MTTTYNNYRVFSNMQAENLSIEEIIGEKERLKTQEKLKRRDITDKLLQESLDRMSIEERFSMLYYYIMNDIYLLDS